MVEDKRIFQKQIVKKIRTKKTYARIIRAKPSGAFKRVRSNLGSAQTPAKNKEENNYLNQPECMSNFNHFRDGFHFSK